jgi:hypothetical protein
MTLQIRSGTIVRGALLTVAILGGLGGLAQAARMLWGHARVFGLVDLFDLSGENNVPTWFSTILLMLSALALGPVAASAHSRREPHAWRWALLAVLLLLVSLAEDASLLERAMRATSPDGGALALPRSFWPTLATLLFIGLATVVLPLWRAVPRQVALQMLLAAVLFVGGHTAFSHLGGALASQGRVLSLAFVAARVLEETCKMAGTAIFLGAALRAWPEGGALRIQAT